MTLTEEFLTMIVPQLDAAIDDALQNEVTDKLFEELGASAETVVYSYEAEPRNMAKRRGKIGDRSNFLITMGGNHTISFKNVTVAQCGIDLEADPVLYGWKSWKQPYPREFMQDAEENFVIYGEFDSALCAGLSRNGFVAISGGGSSASMSSGGSLPF